jgi:hypothetical protein
VGLKLHAEEVGKGILEREQGETISYGVLDPSAFKEDGGPSIAIALAVRRCRLMVVRGANNCPMKPTTKIRFTEPQIALVMRAHPNCNLDRLSGQRPCPFGSSTTNAVKDVRSCRISHH